MAGRMKLTFDEESEVIKLDDAFNDFILKKEVNKSKDTVRNYRTSYEKFKKYFECDETSPVEVMNEGNILHWANSMKKAELTPQSINHYLRDIRTFINWLIERKYIEPFKVELLSYQEEAEKAYSDADLAILKSKPRKEDGWAMWRDWAMVNWVCATGDREATIIEIKIADVDLKEQYYNRRHTKNKKYEKRPLAEDFIPVLKEYLKVCRKGAKPDEWLFPSYVEGKQLTTDALRKSFRKYCLARGVEQHNFHGLRHSFAINAINAGVNMYEIQIMLGHSTPTMTEKYLRSHGLKFNDMREKNPYSSVQPDDSWKKK